MWSHIKNNNIVLEEREIAIALIDELTLAVIILVNVGRSRVLSKDIFA